MALAESSSSSFRGHRPNLYPSLKHSRSQSSTHTDALEIPIKEMDILTVPEESAWPPSASSQTSSFRARQSKLTSSPSARNFHDLRKSSPGPSREGSNSSISSSSSSSASTSTPLILPCSTTGRKVAENLQLFKETAPDVLEPRRSHSRQPTLVLNAPETGASSHPALLPTEEEEEVTQTQFVKRTAWPEREAAAVRRGKSAATRPAMISQAPDRDWESAERNRPSRERVVSTSKNLFHDLREWRQVTDSLERGRKRDRQADTGSDAEESWARSGVTGPIDIPQRPPFSKRDSSHSVRTFHSAQSLPQITTPGHERKRSTVSFTLGDVEEPVALLPEPETTPPPPYPRVETSIPSPGLEESPWSSDSESAWDTASAASSVATTTSPSIGHRRSRHRHQSRNQEAKEDVEHTSLTPPLQHTSVGDGPEDDVVDDEEAYGTLDELDPSSNPLPNVPLRPFRNQVGGHSAIYKFTKRAVCKPLVSRENLFYEAVESAAPPLLGFIPRYLGVMLVNYRKVRKPAATHAAQSESTNVTNNVATIERDDTITPESGLTVPDANPRSPSRPPVRKSITAQGLSATEKAKERAELLSSPVDSPPSSHSRLHDEDSHQASGEETEDAEQPVVQLDSNPHILPGWMLKGRREYYRSLPAGVPSPRGLPGLAPLANEERNPLNRLQSYPAVVSNPDFAVASRSSTVTPGAAEDTELGAPTPSNSPEDHRPILGETKPGLRLDPLATAQVNATDTSYSLEHGPTSPRGRTGVPSISIGITPTSARFYSSSGYPSPGAFGQQPFSGALSPHLSFFGGTGTTTANTKFKDHVFSAIYKRLHRRAGSHLRSLNSTEDEKEYHAEGECEGDSEGAVKRGIKKVRGYRRRSGTVTQKPKLQPAPRPRRESDVGVMTPLSPKASGVKRLILEEMEVPSLEPTIEGDHTLRRVRSEDQMTSPSKLKALASLESSPPPSPGACPHREGMDVFDFDEERAATEQTCGTPAEDVVIAHHGSDVINHRSRSRSVDSPSNDLHFTNTNNPIPLVPNTIAPTTNHSAPHSASPPADPVISRQEHFILMEDLTGKLKRSCVLDLKMGTRQYGVDATAAKKKSQRKKCERTTSKSLGVRICGMQVWNTVTKEYVSQNKYTGREIQPKDFPAVLASFFHNGEKLLPYHIPLILQKLSALAQIIYRLKGFRFYGCSLLFIYDGDRTIQEEYGRSVADSMAASRNAEARDLLSRGRAKSEEREGSRKVIRRTHSDDLLLNPLNGRSSVTKDEKKKRGEVIIRVVDFAHTTTGHDYLVSPPDHVLDTINDEILKSGKGYQAHVDPETGLLYARFPPHHPDLPDLGFLFGLKNLYESLENTYNEERNRRRKSTLRVPSSGGTSTGITTSSSIAGMASSTSISSSSAGITDDILLPLPAEPKEIFSTIFPDPDDSGMISS